LCPWGTKTIGNHPDRGEMVGDVSPLKTEKKQRIVGGGGGIPKNLIKVTAVRLRRKPVDGTKIQRRYQMKDLTRCWVAKEYDLLLGGLPKKTKENKKKRKGDQAGGPAPREGPAGERPQVGGFNRGKIKGTNPSKRGYHFHNRTPGKNHPVSIVLAPKGTDDWA